MTITLRLKTPLAARLDVSGLTPATLAGLSAGQIAARTLPYGGRAVPLGDVFHVTGDAGERLVIEGGDARLDGVGSGLDAGEIRVEGTVGAHAGRAMSGGLLTIAGNAGDGLAGGMSGGRIVVDGDVGAHLGAAPSGARRGMEGGTVVVRGSAGARAGERQRGGLIVIAGNAGEGLATDMIAGTLAVAGRIGAGAGRGMKRGTVLVRAMPDLPEGFADTGTHELVALRLMARRIPDLAGLIGAASHARRLVGDRMQAGTGEFLVV